MQAGRYVTTLRGYKAFEPAHFPLDIIFPPALYRLSERAVKSLGTLDALEVVLPSIDLLIRPYALKEALLSSEIEGTQSTLTEVMAEKDACSKNVNVREVQNYERAVNVGIENLSNPIGLPLSLRLIKELHRVLMTGVRGGEPQKTPGEFRTSQNWIGGSSVKDAFYVPCSPETLPDHLDNFEKAIHAEDFPELIKAALLHYQFETIHPFNDGNGRIGRMLITLFLMDKKLLNRPLLYLSLYFKQYKTAYYDILTHVRETGDYAKWVEFFLNGVIRVSETIAGTTRKILLLKERVKQNIKDPYNVIDFLFQEPFVDAEKINGYIKTSMKTSYNIISLFEEHGVLVQQGNGKRNRIYFFKDYIDILNDTSLVESGDPHA